MKKLTFIIAAFFAIVTASSFAQQQQETVPQAFKYQALARNADGNIIANKNVSFRISIIQGSANGTTVYQETQTATTNNFGIVNLNIGRGSVVSGSFNDIPWGGGEYFIKVEFDPNGGSNYTLMSASEMLSVPYSLYAENANNVQNFPIKAALQATNLAAPLTNPETGMLVYNTDSAGVSPTNVVPGYYYNAGTPQKPKWAYFDASLPSSSTSNQKHENSQSLNDSTGISSPGTDNTTYGGLVRDGTPTNTVFGSATSAPTGSYNTAFGYNTFGGGTNPTGNSNTCVGINGLYSTTSGASNTAMGYNSIYSNTTGEDNTGIGFGVLFNNTASYNTAGGFDAANSNTTGEYNVANGFETMFHNTTSSYNTAMGTYALFENTTATQNTALGYQALYTQSYNSGAATDNVAVGYQALYSNQPTSATNGYQNTALGDYALKTNATGTNNTAIGYKADVSGGTIVDYATAIGSGAIVSSSNAIALGGQSSTNYTFVGIGISNPTADLTVADASTSSATNCHIKSVGTAPSAVVTVGNGVTGVSFATNSTDVCGQIQCTGGNNNTGNTQLTITFNKSYGVAPFVVITPASAGAQTTTYYVSSTTTTFTLYFIAGSTGTPPYFNYHVIE